MAEHLDVSGQVAFGYVPSGAHSQGDRPGNTVDQLANNESEQKQCRQSHPYRYSLLVAHYHLVLCDQGGQLFLKVSCRGCQCFIDGIDFRTKRCDSFDRIVGGDCFQYLVERFGGDLDIRVRKCSEVCGNMPFCVCERGECIAAELSGIDSINHAVQKTFEVGGCLHSQVKSA